jgi:hypothetical protein
MLTWSSEPTRCAEETSPLRCSCWPSAARARSGLSIRVALRWPQTPRPALCSLVRSIATHDRCVPMPVDVACNSNADCTSFERPSCGCTSLVYGVNRAALARLYSECPLPPCVERPPPNPCVDAAVGLHTQDCELSPRGRNVLAACVDHQCRTFEPATGSE